MKFMPLGKSFREFSKDKYDFAQTPAGSRAGFFATIPLLCFIFFLVTFLASRGSEMEQVLRYFLLTNACISLVGWCIAQLQYGNMVNDFIASNKK